MEISQTLDWEREASRVGLKINRIVIVVPWYVKHVNIHNFLKHDKGIC